MEDDVLKNIGTIARALDAIANVEFKQFDLTKGQYVYLVRICEHPGIVQSHLAELVKIDRSTAARAIKKLEASGLIARKKQPGNDKNKALFPTDKGLAIYPTLKRENDYSNEIALTGISETDRQKLLALTKQMAQNVAADWTLVKDGHKRPY
ncbi:MarR family winged helix-turn-helix transcriptional regulator [Secundilactobacillus collinoides]|uniref:Transcriptional regulator n=1 Tax=Secundilactobacillus collinoides DSM 20515 = JCM 1123 TaxID=1423733 RepID=A0A0R2B7J3_SECCO|nr:MarR family winged helix-turn-helix transcriptional regulator [Secundilactobacillus collinoides]KRM75297.1 transcriptional regulator [Secundilactobacillus collinoides DSM 20515 = JCM 1123]